MKNKIELTKEKETLLIPLMCRALESGKSNPIISDPKAAEIVGRIEYDFESLKIPKQTHVTVCMRAKIFDDLVLEPSGGDRGGVVIQLGCGLDSRCERAGRSGTPWYDLDFPEVISLRKNFYSETPDYRMIPSSVTDYRWLDNFPDKKTPATVLAEGLFMYLKEEEVKTLIRKLAGKFTETRLIFDSYSALTARNIKNHPSVKKTGAVIHWGIDRAGELERWDESVSLTGEYFFTESDEVSKLSPGYRFLFRIMGLFPAAKKAHRVIEVRIRQPERH